MKNVAKKNVALVVTAFVLAGCITQESVHLPESVIEVRTGVYATNVAGDLPLPTSGYDMYVMGEWHGICEIQLLFLDYLKTLHETAGVCDIILEEDQVYERDANQYVSGVADTLCANLCLRTNILTSVREYNETPQGPYIREDTLTRNIQYILEELNGAPVLAFFGSGHTQKTQGYVSDYAQNFKSWTQRLAESGVTIYSVSVWGLSGNAYWRWGMDQVTVYADRMTFDDGTTLRTLFDTVPDYTVIYLDLRLDANKSFKFGEPYRDIPAQDMYDGIVIFRKVTPMEWACPQKVVRVVRQGRTVRIGWLTEGS